MQFLQVLKNYFKSKALGFYFTAAAVVLSFVQLVVYIAGFTPPAWVSYMHWSVVFFSVMAIVAGAGLAVTKVTASWAPAAVTALEFLSFLMFIRYGYMYFSQIFFSGVSASLFFQMYYGYLASLFLYVIVLVIGVAALFLKQNKKASAAEMREGALV